QGKLLGQCANGEFLRNSENRARPPPRIPRSRYRAARPVRLYRRLLQSAAHPLRHRLHHPTASRGEIRVTRCPLFRGKVTGEVVTFGRLYGKFGFHPYFLTAFMAASVAAQKMTSAVSRDSAFPE